MAGVLANATADPTALTGVMIAASVSNSRGMKASIPWADRPRMNKALRIMDWPYVERRLDDTFGSRRRVT